jgi:LPS-assembly lipoprotein
MSSLKSRRRLLQGLAGALLLVGPTACFRPLYGPTATGAPLQDQLAAIEVAMIETPQGQERLGHYLRSELMFELDGSGQPRPKRYRLTISATETVQGTTVDVTTGRANSATLNGAATFTLTTLDGTRIFLRGTARGTATYFRDEQRFANVRAARDADIRVAKLIAEDIKMRIAALFATTS